MTDTVEFAGYGTVPPCRGRTNDTSSSLGVVMLVAFLGLSWVLSRKLERVAEQAK